MKHWRRYWKDKTKDAFSVIVYDYPSGRRDTYRQSYDYMPRCTYTKAFRYIVRVKPKV